ncbi:MAG: FHA domain-containing protein [Actinomycetota bacterium]
MPVATPIESPVVVVREPGRTPLYLILNEPLEIGRDGSGLLLDDPGVSRRHLRLRSTEGVVMVEDIESSNGTFLDGERVTGPVPLRPGATVRVGDTTIEVLPTPTQFVEPPQPGARRTSIEELVSAVTPDDLVAPAFEHARGTVTIVFTDIESSTAMSAGMGDEKWADLLWRHNELIRQKVRVHGGVEVKARGDGFMLVFDSANQALRAMIETQRAIGSGLGAGHPPIRVRVGAHTGEAIVDDSGDLIGYHVNLAARIADQAGGGEILVSSLLKEIVEPRGEFRFGEARMADIKGLGNYLLHPVVWAT